MVEFLAVDWNEAATQEHWRFPLGPPGKILDEAKTLRGSWGSARVLFTLWGLICTCVLWDRFVSGTEVLTEWHKPRGKGREVLELLG